MEEIIHMFAETMERDPTLDVFCADGDNAFNAANRIRGLGEVKDNFPAALAYAKDMYLEESTAWYHGLPDNIKPVFCRNGYHQGHVLASWLYVMTIQPLLVHIIPDEWFLVKFYVDDGKLHSSIQDHARDYQDPSKQLRDFWIQVENKQRLRQSASRNKKDFTCESWVRSIYYQDSWVTELCQARNRQA